MKIILTFNPDGSTVTEVEGIVGRSCKDATAFLEKELGCGKTKLKAEFYQSDTVSRHQKLR